MKGYMLPGCIDFSETEKTEVMVGCMRCRRTWPEERVVSKHVRRNSAYYDYHCCDACITEEERKLVNPKPSEGV